MTVAPRAYLLSCAKTRPRFFFASPANHSLNQLVAPTLNPSGTSRRVPVAEFVLHALAMRRQDFAESGGDELYRALHQHTAVTTTPRCVASCPLFLFSATGTYRHETRLIRLFPSRLLTTRRRLSSIPTRCRFVFITDSSASGFALHLVLVSLELFDTVVIETSV